MKGGWREPRELRRLRERLDDLRSRIYYIDVQTLGDHITSIVLEFLHKLRIKKKDKLSSILSNISDTVRAYFPFSFSSLFTADIVSMAAKLALEGDPDAVKERLEKALRELIVYSTRSLDELSINLSRLINVGSEVLVFGYTDALAKIILSVSGKIERVHTISYWPLMTGRGFASRLHKAGLNVMAWPDSAASQAIGRVDYVILPVLGVSADNVFVSEAGAYMLSLLAEDEGKELVLIGRTWNFRPSTPRGANNVEIEAEHPLQRGLTLKIRVFDLVPLHKASTIVTEAGINVRIRPERVKEVYASMLKTFTSILTHS